MKKKFLTITLVVSAVVCYVFANMNIISDKVEALVESIAKG